MPGNNLTDRLMTPAIHVRCSNVTPLSNLTTNFSNVLVVVVVDGNVRLGIRNVSSLYFVEPLPANSSQLLDVAFELRSGSVVELYDVPHFVRGDSVGTRFAFSAFNASIQLTFTAQTASLGTLSVLRIDASGGGGGSIDVVLTQCNVTILQLAITFLLLWGNAVSIANVRVAFNRCNLSIPSSVVSVLGDVTSTVTSFVLASQHTILRCNRSVLSITGGSSAVAIDVAVTFNSCSVSLDGTRAPVEVLLSSMRLRQSMVAAPSASTATAT